MQDVSEALETPDLSAMFPVMPKGVPRERMMLRRQAIDELADAAGLKTLTEVARHVGISQPAFWRLYHHKKAAGGPTVRRIVEAEWDRPVTIQDLFEVVPS
jgi:hypothetical protein